MVVPLNVACMHNVLDQDTALELEPRARERTIVVAGASPDYQTSLNVR